MLKVLRLKPGNTVWCTNGAGQSGLFRIFGVEKHRVWLQAVELERHESPQQRVVLALGWAKALRRGWLFEKAVELEASGIWLWQAKHSQGKVPEEGKDNWRAQCIAGAKQCKNPWLPELATFPGGARELAAAVPAFTNSYLLWEESGCDRLLTMEDLRTTGDTLFILGPEGGLSREEVALLQNGGARPVSLGKRVLRWETAALLCLGLSWWSRQSGQDAP